MRLITGCFSLLEDNSYHHSWITNTFSFLVLLCNACVVSIILFSICCWTKSLFTNLKLKITQAVLSSRCKRKGAIRELHAVSVERYVSPAWTDPDVISAAPLTVFQFRRPHRRTSRRLAWAFTRSAYSGIRHRDASATATLSSTRYRRRLFFAISRIRWHLVNWQNVPATNIHYVIKIKYSLSSPYEKVLTSSKLTILCRRSINVHLLIISSYHIYLFAQE